MTKPTKVELAWLAGLWDGEGSTGWNSNRVAVQMCMTCEMTIRRAIDICDRLGCTALGYTYQEKKPQHKDAHHMRVNRIADVYKMALALEPYAVTKRKHWQVAMKLCKLRIDKWGIDKDGRLKRGGNAYKTSGGYSPRELKLVAQLCALNKRGK